MYTDKYGTYVGNTKNERPERKGILTLIGDQTFTGDWRKGELNGQVKIDMLKGESYVGG